MPSPTEAYPSDFLVAGMDLPAVPKAPEICPPGTHCAMTGRLITEGYKISAITTDATNEFLDTFRGDAAGFVHENVARAFKGDWNLGARLLTENSNGTIAHDYPLISNASAAEQGRPCWSDLLRSVWRTHAGANVLILLTTDSKKRLWPRSRVGPLGAATPVYLHDSGVSQSVTVNWLRLITTMDLIESVYTAGFSKRAIGDGLWSDMKAVQANGLTIVRSWERQLFQMRDAPEFAPALLVAQKPLEGK